MTAVSKPISNLDTFIIIHGLYGSPPGHWQCWLRDRLVEAGFKVRFPEMSEANCPNLITWLDELHQVLREAGQGATLVAHSLGAVLWLHYASVPHPVKMRRVLLVAPPGGAEIKHHPRISGYQRLVLDPVNINQSADEVLMVGSEADPYCQRGFFEEYARELELHHLQLPDSAGHVNLDSGFGPWPFALGWCRGASHTSAPEQRSIPLARELAFVRR